MAKIELRSEPGESLTVELQRGTAHRFSAVINGERVEGLFRTDMPGSGVLRLGDRVLPCHFHRNESRIEVWLGGEIHSFEIMGARGRSTAATSGPVAKEILAPMPGTVLRIEVKAGEAFAAHQPLIIMESMKMEMTLSAPHAGRVTQIACAVGELVPMGKVLASLEAVESDADVSAKS